MKARISYILFLLLCGYLFIMYHQEAAKLLLGFAILLPAVALCMALCMRRGIAADISTDSVAVTKGQKARVSIIVKNNSWFPVSDVQLELDIEHVFSADKQQQECRTELNAGETRVIEYEIKTDFCGKQICRLKRVLVRDYFGLFCLRKRIGQSGDILVLPGNFPLDLSVSEYTRRFPAESDEYDPARPGDDPSEIFGIRDYIPGDSMARINWKMTAKTDQLMVKEFSRPIGCTLLLVLDFFAEDSPEQLKVKMDKLLENTCSMGTALLKEEMGFYIGWYEERSRELVFMKVREPEDLEELILRLAAVERYEVPDIPEQLRQAALQKGQYSHCLLLNMEGMLKKDGELLSSDLAGEHITV